MSDFKIPPRRHNYLRFFKIARVKHSRLSIPRRKPRSLERTIDLGGTNVFRHKSKTPPYLLGVIQLFFQTMLLTCMIWCCVGAPVVRFNDDKENVPLSPTLSPKMDDVVQILRCTARRQTPASLWCTKATSR